MNFQLPHIPKRSVSPREKGLTMIMDKGLSYMEAKNMISSSAKYIDLVKLGFGTSYLTEDLEKKYNFIKMQALKYILAGHFLNLLLFVICLINM